MVDLVVEVVAQVAICFLFLLWGLKGFLLGFASIGFRVCPQAQGTHIIACHCKCFSHPGWGFAGIVFVGFARQGG